MYPELIARGFARNDRVIVAHAEGLTHEDSLRQSGYNTNCFNWVLGHIVATRDDILRVLGADPVFGSAGDRYRRESDPVRAAGPGVVALTDLLIALGASAERLGAVLRGATAEFMAEDLPTGDGRTATRAAQVMFGWFHDTYHTGQLDVIRQLSGKSDKVI